MLVSKFSEFDLFSHSPDTCKGLRTICMQLDSVLALSNDCKQQKPSWGAVISTMDS